MTQNIELMRAAKASLRGGSWGKAALVTFLMSIIIGASGFTYAGPLIIAGPMSLGFVLFLKELKFGNKSVKIEKMFDGFNDFGRAFLANLLLTIFVFLWSLLLFIPGIIMGIAYSMTYFILAEDKEISAMDAIRLSRDMMRGYKWKYFCLMLRFIGWWLLTILTLGVLSFWVQPYVMMTALHFYEDIKADRAAQNFGDVAA
jgi:uncharacterized membrane protein